MDSEVRAHNFSVLLGNEESVESTPKVETAAVEETTKQMETLKVDTPVEIDDSWSTVAHKSHGRSQAGSTHQTNVQNQGEWNNQQQRRPYQPRNGPHHTVGQNQQRTLRKEIVPRAENSFELYDFPSTLQTIDLHKFLKEFEGLYALKWQNDSSCWAVFNNDKDGMLWFFRFRLSLIAAIALAELLERGSDVIKVRSFASENLKLPEKPAAPAAAVQPAAGEITPKPQTAGRPTASAATVRTVFNALGINKPAAPTSTRPIDPQNVRSVKIDDGTSQSFKA